MLTKSLRRRTDENRRRSRAAPEALFWWEPGLHVPGRTFSRASTASYAGRDLDLAEAASGELRNAHYALNPVTGLYERAARLEAARTNSLTRSEEFDHGDWGKLSGLTVTADNAVAPDGSVSADRLEPAGGAADRVSQSVSVSDDSLDRTLFAWFRKNESPHVKFVLEFNGGTTVVDGVIEFDTTDGSIISTSGVVRADVVDYNSDWWKVYVVASNNGTGNTSANVVIQPDAADGNDNQHVWGAQLEGVSGGASFPSSYIPTTSSTVTRSADDLTYPAFEKQESTMYGKFTATGHTGLGDKLAFVGQAKPSESFWGVDWNASDLSELRVEHGDGSNVESASVSGLSVNRGDVVEFKAVLNSDGSTDIGVSVNGGSETTSSSGSTASLTDFSDQMIGVCRAGAGTARHGMADFIALTVVPGVRTMEYFRSLPRINAGGISA